MKMLARAALVLFAALASFGAPAFAANPLPGIWGDNGGLARVVSGRPFSATFKLLDATGAVQDLTGRPFTLSFRTSDSTAPIVIPVQATGTGQSVTLAYSAADTATIYNALRSKAGQLELDDLSTGLPVRVMSLPVTVSLATALNSTIVPPSADQPTSTVTIGANSALTLIEQTGGLNANAALRSLNLADLPDPAAARANLGLKGAATASIGTGVGMVAAGDVTAAALQTKASQVDLTSGLASKVDTTTYTAGLSTKADEAAVISSLALKADAAATATALGLKADESSVASRLAAKANSADVTTQIASAVAPLATTTALTQGLAPKANSSDVAIAISNAVAPLVTSTALAQGLAPKANNVDVSASISSAVAPLATSASVTSAISSATAGLAPTASPTFTGTPSAPTAAAGTNTSQLATTAFVTGAIGTAPLAPLASPSFTGTPTVPTASAGTSSTQAASTAFVATAASNAASTASLSVLRATRNVYNAVIDGGLVPNSAADQTSAIAATLTAAAAAGKTAFFPAGKYNYCGVQNNTASIVGEGQTRTIFNNICPLGKTGLFDFQNVNDLVLSGFSIVAQYGAGVTGSENDSGIRLTNVSRYTVSDIRFVGITGAALLQRNSSFGLVIGNCTLNGWHDSFHITGSSHDITEIANCVINGGDDGFAVVGYTNAGVRPYNILIIGNRVWIIKYARALAIVGAQNVTAIGNLFSRARVACVYVSVDTAYATYANDNIDIEHNTLDGCGAASSVSLDTSGYTSASMPAAYFSAVSGFNNTAINFRDNIVRNSANTAILNAAYGGYCILCDFSGNVVDGTWDPYNLNGFPLTTSAATSGSPTLPMTNTAGVAVGQDVIYNAQRIGAVVSATASTVTLDTNATVPAGATVYFKAGGFLPTTAKLTAAVASGATTLPVPTSGIYGTNSMDPTSIYVGAVLSGTGLATDTVVTGVTPTNITIAPATTAAIASGGTFSTSPPWYFPTYSTTASAAASAGATTFTVAANKGIAKGQAIAGTGIANGTYVQSIIGLTVTPTQPLSGALASGATVTFGFVPMSASVGILLSATKDVIVRGNRVRSAGQYGIVGGDGLSGLIDIRDNIGEEIGNVSPYGRFIQIAGTLAAGSLLKLDENYLALPSNWPRQFDANIYSSYLNWPYTQYGPNNKVQNNAIGNNLGLNTVTATQTLSGSPYTYTNNFPSSVSVSVIGGTVSDVSIKRNGQAVAFTASTSSPGLWDLRPGDSIIITYTSAPTVTVIPRMAAGLDLPRLPAAANDNATKWLAA